MGQISSSAQYNKEGEYKSIKNLEKTIRQSYGQVSELQTQTHIDLQTLRCMGRQRTHGAT
jgi:hypothetical protein